MGIFSKKRIENASAILSGDSLPWVPQWARKQFRNWTYQTIARDGYAGNTAVYNCIGIWQSIFSEAPIKIYDANDPEKELPNHPATELINNPHPDYDQAELSQFLIGYAAIGGSCYVDKVPGKGRLPAALVPYHDGQIAPQIGEMNVISKFVYDLGDGNTKDVSRDRMFRVSWPAIDPRRPWMPLGPVLALANNIDMDNEAVRMAYALTANDASPRTAYTLEAAQAKQLGDVKMEAIRATIKKMFGGASRGEPFVGAGSWHIEKLGFSLRDMDYSNLHNIPESRIAGAFKMSPVLASLYVGIQNMTYSNLDGSFNIFTKQHVVPMWNRFGKALTRGIAPSYGGGIIVKYDTSNIVALRESQEVVARQAREDFAGNLITLDEARARMNEPADITGNGAKYFYQLTGVATPATFERTNN